MARGRAGLAQVPSAWALALSEVGPVADANGSVKVPGMLSNVYSSQKKKELVEASTITALDPS